MQIVEYPNSTQVFLRNALEALKKLDTHDVCVRSGAKYDPATGKYALTCMGSRAQISVADGTLTWDLPVTGLFHTLLLHYMVCTDGVAPQGDLISVYDAVPAASSRAQHIIQANVPPLVQHFAQDMPALFQAAEQLGGEQLSEDTVRVLALPQVPVQVTVWPAEEEFPADARLLFDRTVLNKLPAESLVYVADVVVQALVWTVDKNYTFLNSL